jgi:hypothetical protein
MRAGAYQATCTLLKQIDQDWTKESLTHGFRITTANASICITIPYVLRLILAPVSGSAAIA